MIAPVLGLLAGLVAIADAVPYIRDMRRGTTRPHRGTWLVWSVLAVVACASTAAEGVTWSLVMVATQAVLTTLILVLAVRRGLGGTAPADLLMIAVAAVGVAAWLAAGEPLVAIVGVIVADLAGALMMLPKTWRDPRSETLSTFALASLSGALAVGAVGSFEPALLLFPAWYCLVNGAIALVIVDRRAVLARHRVAA